MCTRPMTAWCIGLRAAAPCGRAAALLVCMACMQVGRSVRWSPTASRRWGPRSATRCRSRVQAAPAISDKLMEQMERAYPQLTRSGPMCTRPMTAWCIGLRAAAPCGRAAALLVCMACMQVGRSVRWSPTASRRWGPRSATRCRSRVQAAPAAAAVARAVAAVCAPPRHAGARRRFWHTWHACRWVVQFDGLQQLLVGGVHDPRRDAAGEFKRLPQRQPELGRWRLIPQRRIQGPFGRFRRWARRRAVGASALFCVAMKKWELQLPLFCVAMKKWELQLPLFTYIPSNTLHFLPRRKKVSEVPVVIVGFFGLAHHI